MTISREQQMEWLELEKKKREGLLAEDREEWHRLYSCESDALKQEIIIIDAILSALEGPSEEERKELLAHFDEYCPGSPLPMGCKKCNKIRALILGHAAKEGEE